MRPVTLENAPKRMLNPPCHRVESSWLLETNKAMTCEREMDLFFARNCYSQKEREKVKASLAYRLAMEKNDATQAQEIATRVLEDK